MAIIKDYYRILNVKSSASLGEIKNAYRKLAMKYHPDRNPGDPLAAAVFTDAAEAYKILSEADARRRYNYKRYLTAEDEYERPVETIQNLIFHIRQINQQVKKISIYHLNKDALFYCVKQSFPGDITPLLQTDNILLRQFLQEVCTVVEHLSSRQTKEIILFLQPFFSQQPWLQNRLQQIFIKQEKEHRWEKYKIVLAIVLAVVLCVLIFLVAGN